MKTMRTKITNKISIIIALFLMAGLWQSCSEDTPPPPLKAEVTQKVDNKTVKIIFDKKVDKASAEKPENYLLSLTTNKGTEDIVPQKATATGQTVVLTFEKMFKEGNYTIKINNVKGEDGGLFAGIAKGFTHKVMWKKIENMEVKTSTALEEKAPWPLTTFSFKDQKRTEVSFLDIMTKPEERKKFQNSDWDILFYFNGNEFFIHANRSNIIFVHNEKGYIFSIKENADAIKSGAKYDKMKEEDTYGGVFVLADIPKSARESYKFPTGTYLYHVYYAGLKNYDVAHWCVKESKNEEELVKLIGTKEYAKLPFKIYKDRTLVVKTGDGKRYAKMIVDAVYKDNKAPKVVPENYTYSLTFRYVLSEEGSDDLDFPVDIE